MPEIVYTITIAFILLYILPLGGDFGILNTYRQGLWLAVPMNIMMIKDVYTRLD